MRVKELMVILYKMAVKNPEILDMYVLSSDHDGWWYDLGGVEILRAHKGKQIEDEETGGETVLALRAI